MKALSVIFALLLSATVFAQQHGTVYGTKPSETSMVKAANLETFMGKKTRISTTISGQVLKVTKTKGGWFDIDGGNGKIIAAHFSRYDVNIPESLKGHYVVVEGIAQKQIISDDLQHLAGDTVTGQKQHTMKADPKRRLTFEVKGLMVEK
jgi:hypothetical protein